MLSSFWHRQLRCVRLAWHWVCVHPISMPHFTMWEKPVSFHNSRLFWDGWCVATNRRGGRANYMSPGCALVIGCFWEVYFFCPSKPAGDLNYVWHIAYTTLSKPSYSLLMFTSSFSIKCYVIGILSLFKESQLTGEVTSHRTSFLKWLLTVS